MSNLKEGQIIINVDEIAGDLATAMLIRFQGPKVLDKHNNLLPTLQKLHDKIYTQIYREITGAAVKRWNDISSIDDVEFPCVYVIQLSEMEHMNPLDIKTAADDIFKEESIRQNNTYSLLRFEEIFNDSKFDIGESYIRIL